jgi:hypothetical protein
LASKLFQWVQTGKLDPSGTQEGFPLSDLHEMGSTPWHFYRAPTRKRQSFGMSSARI